MEDYIKKMVKKTGKQRHEALLTAVVDGLVNGLAIFTFTLGGLMLASGSFNGFEIKGAVITATGVGLLRFSLRLYEEKGIDMAGLEGLPMVPDIVGDKEKKTDHFLLNILWQPQRLTSLCKLI